MFCKSLSRISRDSLELIQFIRLLIDKEILLNEGGRFVYDLRNRMFEYEISAALYQYEIENKSKAIKWAYKRGFERGNVYMTRLYGYSSKENNIEVITSEAEVVRKTYQLYLQGYSETKIAELFNENGYLNKSGKVDWSYKRIKDILTNIKYTGATIGPKTYNKNLLTGKRYLNDCFNQYYFNESHEGIISRDIYDKAQEFRQKSLTNGVRKRQTETSLSRKIICGECGSYYRRKVYYNRDKTIRSVEWKCSRACKKKSDCQESKAFQEKYVLEQIFKQLSEDNIHTPGIDNFNVNNMTIKNILDRYLEKIEVVKDKLIVYLKCV